MASSSYSNDQFDVFLSFRGEDTRYNFTSHLYDALCRNNIKAFIDYRIHRGDEITPALERVIEDAKISVIVFSKNYADSTFCLDELVRIMGCKESKAQIVLPIFYKVDPSEVTYQEAFARHETTTSGMKNVERWRLAFGKALEVAGWHIVKNSDEAEIIGKITNEVSEKLNNNIPKGEQLMYTPMVGQTAEDNYKIIWECLMNDKISRVGVYGMGGVGKTTIATRINDQLLATVNSFSLVLWVTVSKDLSISSMQNKIAKVVNLDLSKEDDERKRAAMLRKRLRFEKFALILDDVWEDFEIEDIGIPPLIGQQKLFLTSRSRRVCERMECVAIEVRPLSKFEALVLFIVESKYQINESPECGDIVCSIVEECAGLPLAIVVVARRMRRVMELWKWRDTLRELRKPCDEENSEMEKKVYRSLKFSYDHLPNDRCRQCFLYCSLFPEDHVFRREDLMEYWIGEGLIDELDCRQAESDKGNVILDELIHSSLLEQGTTERSSGLIKMHDVIRDMARINVKVGLRFQDPLESVGVLNKTILKSFPNSAPHCSKLRTLVLRGYDIKDLPGCLFANMQSLNVLHITNMTSLKSIPDSIANLGNLKLLIVKNCDNLECIPSLVGLEKLRQLNISWNNKLKEIPNGIERFVNLRVLDLSKNSILNGTFPFNVAKNLSHVQTLNFRGSKVEAEPDALISLEKLEILTLTFYNLDNLNCYVKSGHWRRLLDYQIIYGAFDIIWLKKGMCLTTIEDASSLFLPYDIQHLWLLNWESPMFYAVKNTTFAHLQTIGVCTYKSKFLFTIDLAQRLLHNVRELRIDCCYGLEEIIAREEECPTILFPKLKTLKLFYLLELRSIYKGRIMCPSLELVVILSSVKIERLPFCLENDGNMQNPSIILREGGDYIEEPVSRRWWESLKWDDPNDKSLYLIEFDSEIESESSV